MKKSLIYGAFAVLMSTATMVSAAGKVGYVNLQQVVDKSAYSQRLRDKITQDLTPVGQEVQALGTQIGALRQKLAKDGLTMKQSQRQQIEREIRSKMLEAKLREASFKEESQMREQEALSQVTDKALSEIEKIAKAEGYDLIVHNEAVLYAVEAVDLTDQVAKALK